MKKVYIIPVVEIEITDLKKTFLEGASGEGMGYGGGASDSGITDADAKGRTPFESQSSSDSHSTFDRGLW